MQPESPLRDESRGRPPSEGAALDEADLLDRVGGDRGLLREIVGIFLDTSPRRLAELREAIDRADAATVHRQAHTFKSMVGHFGAAAAVHAALRLEQMGAGGDLAGAREAWAALERAVEQLRPALTRLLDDGGRS